ncbi:hypothetical protein HII13_004604 [Brettanomyces bruxellensis]|uniref:SGNH hydrolase-type esterase domain-containing protein n=1 Tax=Dekkera bruxellensis TaxID=5007 RepID=A0A8H6B953_DEKBR|nr:hypothetical protein HII13_004604 [Brettanomyces bruxellensis]KAF6007405.1 hypothetical protein HII12_004566 [Brettanomyces bruxellensis]
MTSPFQFKRFLMFGDSITEFAFNEYPPTYEDEPQFTLGAGLSNAYTRKLEVVQRGFSGYTSRDAAKLIGPILKYEHDLRSANEKIVLAYAFFGTNDARLQGTNPENNQHIDIDEYVANMMKVVAEFKKRDIPVIVVTPGLHDQELWAKVYPEDMETGDYRSSAINKQYADAMAEKCRAEDIPVVHLYNSMKQFLDAHPQLSTSDLLVDGIHLKGKGYKILYDAMMKIIKARYPSLDPTNMKQRFPEWRFLGDDTVFE